MQTKIQSATICSEANPGVVGEVGDAMAGAAKDVVVQLRESRCDTALFKDDVQFVALWASRTFEVDHGKFRIDSHRMTSSSIK